MKPKNWLKKTPRRGKSRIAQGKRSGALGIVANNTNQRPVGAISRFSIVFFVLTKRIPQMKHKNLV